MSHMGPGMMDKPKSSKKTIILVVILCVIVLAAWLVIRGNQPTAQDMLQQAPAQVFDTTPAQPQPTDPAVTQLQTQSSSDTSTDIEKDLNNTSFDSISQ